MPRGWLEQLLAPIGLWPVVREANRAIREADPERPDAVHLDDRSRAVLERANSLAAEGREDGAAVAEIVRVAGGRSKTLDEALLASRFRGFHLERLVENRTFRLLSAATASTDVQPVAPSLAARIDAIGAFEALNPDRRWRMLVERQPPLEDLAIEAREGVFSARPAPDVNVSRDGAAGMMRLDDRLSGVVGPQAGSDDTVVGSEAAYDSALRALMGMRPAPGI
jgi:hypothetical protein